MMSFCFWTITRTWCFPIKKKEHAHRLHKAGRRPRSELPRRGPSRQRNLRNRHTNKLSRGHAVTRQAGTRQGKSGPPLRPIATPGAANAGHTASTCRNHCMAQAPHNSNGSPKVTPEAAGYTSGSRLSSRQQHLPRNHGRPSSRGTQEHGEPRGCGFEGRSQVSRPGSEALVCTHSDAHPPPRAGHAVSAWVRSPSMLLCDTGPVQTSAPCHGQGVG